MPETSPQADVSLPEFLIYHARRASDGRLALAVGGGALVAILASVWRPWGWTLLLPAALCAASFGAWGIADRELCERAGEPPGRTTIALRGARAAAAVVGGVAGTMLLLGVTAMALGTWIS